MTLSLSNLTDVVLSWLLIYGPTMLLVLLFLGAMGLPIPGTFLVLATGAFVRQGIFALEFVAICAWLGALSGDVVGFGLGRFARGFVQQRFGSSALWQRAEWRFNQRSGIAIYLTRWLLTPIAVPVNLVAGGTGYPFHKFVLYDAAGEATWVLLYGALGYLFSSYWEDISELVHNFTWVLVGVAIVGSGIYMIVQSRDLRKRRKRRKGGAADAGISPLY